MKFDKIVPPAGGERISVNMDSSINVPGHPIIPFIVGDGIGIDVTPVMQAVVEAAVQKAYGGERRIVWMEVFAGEKAAHKYGKDIYLPDETLHAMHDYVVSIKGPLGTPVGGGIRSLNVTIRQTLDLYACVRPIRYFPGVSTPMKDSELTDMVVFRENTEDIYAGIEWAGGGSEAQRVLDFLAKEDPQAFAKIRFGTQARVNDWLALLESAGAPRRTLPVEVGIGIKPVSRLGTERLVHSAIGYAIKNQRKSVTLVHKGNIMKFTEGGFRDWGYQTARDFFGAVEHDGGPWHVIPAGKPGAGLIIKDVIADAFLQQILLRPAEYDVVATLNLNGDYLSDALAAQVGGIGIAPGGNINYITGHAVFEATHGTAPKYAGQDKVNPGSLILSGEMMLRYMGWNEAADALVRAMDKAIAAKHVTYDFARLMDGATEVKCSQFGDRLIAAM